MAIQNGINLTETGIVTHDGAGGYSGSAVTEFGLVVGSASNEVSSLPLGTSGQVLKSNGAGSPPSFQAESGGGLTWNVETGTSATMSVNNGYFANNASLITFTLPTIAAVGDIVHVIGMGAGLFKIAQNASEDISFSNVTTTSGTGGSITSLDQYASLELICSVANTNWIVKSSTSNYSII